jgi:hypothetical protein
MMQKFSMWLDRFSEFYALRKGLLPLIAIVFIVLNFILEFLPATWLSQTDLLLHVGILLAIMGFLLARAL